MNLNSLYVLFFAITVGAFAPTEASSVPAAANTSEAPSPGDTPISADQRQQNDNMTLVKKESLEGSSQPKKTRLAKVLATAGAAALALAFVFFILHMKGYITKEEEGEVPAEEEEEFPPPPYPEAIPAPAGQEYYVAGPNDPHGHYEGELVWISGGEFRHPADRD